MHHFIFNYHKRRELNLTSKISIQKSSILDADEISKLETECFDYNVYPINEIKNIIRTPRYTILKASADKQCVGYIIYSVVVDECDLDKIAVKNECRHKGIGKLLMDEMLRDLIKRGVKKVYLEVDAENKHAISLYEKLNFEKIDKRTNYYSNGHNAIVYVLNL